MKTWKYLCVIVVMIAAFAVTGCNTFKGVGQDIEGAGEAIQKGAQKTKDAITK